MVLRGLKWGYNYSSKEQIIRFALYRLSSHQRMRYRDSPSFRRLILDEIEILLFFSYSVLSSLNYASCSYMTNSSFVMEPDLSFMDTSYSDVIYFADPDSRNSYWNIRQFKFDKDGYFKAMETFIVKNFAEGLI